MSVIDVERAAPAAPAPRSFASLWDLGVRLILLGVLAAAWLSLVPASTAVQRSPAQLLGDLKAGKAHSVQYRNASREVRWTDGALRWYRADIIGVGVAGLAPTNGAPTTDGSEGSPPDDDYRAWVSRAIATSPHHVTYQEIDTGQLSWTDQLPWHGLSVATGFAVLVAFFMMLGRNSRRFGNRWAWFWVFVVVGNGVGPFLFLLLEPAPLWQRDAVRRQSYGQAYSGGTGLVVAVGLKIVLGLAIGIALNRL
jgi:hypothetical protein